MKHNLPFRDLDEEFKKWGYENLGPDYVVTLDEWIEEAGSLRELAAYARVLWPDFIEHDGCVFRHDAALDQYESWLAKQNGDKTAVEALLNHVHVAADLFGFSSLDGTELNEKSPSRELVIYVGRLLKDVWQAKLNRDFPGRSIVVDLMEQDCNGLIDYQITFYQERKTQSQ